MGSWAGLAAEMKREKSSTSRLPGTPWDRDLGQGCPVRVEPGTSSVSAVMGWGQRAGLEFPLPLAASLLSLQEPRACQPLTQPHEVTACGLFPHVQHSGLWRACCVSSELSSNLSPPSSHLTLRFPPTYSGADRAGPKVYFIIISGH